MELQIRKGIWGLLRMLLVLCLFNLLCPATLSYGQSSNVNSSPSRMLPPPPEAAALGKFGDIPVGLYSGVPSISVPIYSIDINGYSLPIGLGYHASGVKVEEISSSIGIGWALNAGGVISCNVRGLYDFDTNHGLFGMGNTIYSKYKDGSLAAAARGGTGPNNPAGSPDHNLVKDMAAGSAEGEPDEFSFSFGGRSGKFMFDENGIPRSMPYEPLQILFNRTNNTFTIIDEKGVRFLFSELEQVSVDNAPGATVPLFDYMIGNVTYAPTWYLKKIIAPGGDEITFFYNSLSYSYNFNANETKYDAPFGYGSNVMAKPIDEISMGIMNVVGGKRISSIESSRGHVVQFVYGTTTRKDLPGTYGLEDIHIKYNQSAIASWHLDQGYFVANANATDPENFRLKLNSVQQAGNGAYVFEYEGGLPSRKSKDQDYWGYYNGRANSTLVPKITVEGGVVLSGADRSVNPLMVQAGILKKIVYPTGGSTELTYEPNDYYFDGQERIYTPITTPTLTLNGSGTQTYTFTTGNGVNQGDILFQSNVETNLTPGDVLSARLQGGLLNENFETLSKQKTVSLSPNTTYTLTLFSTADHWTGSNGVDRPLQATLEVRWSQASNQPLQKNLPAGGLRVFQTEDRSSATDLPKIKRYLYRAEQEDTRSSGYMINEPVSSFFRTIYDLNPDHPSTYLAPRTYVARTSNSISSLSSVKGGSVGYGSVIVLDGATGENGKVVSTYRIDPDLMSHHTTVLGVITNAWPHVYTRPTSYDFLRGLLMEETTYRKTASGFSKVKQVNNKYKISNDVSCFLPCEVQGPNNKNILSLRSIMTKPQTIVGASILHLGPGEFELLSSYHISNWFQLDSTITKSFDELSSNPIEAVTVYGYGNPVHAQLTSSTTKHSDGRTITTRTSYVDDYLPGTTFLDNMRMNHQIGIPIEQVSYKETGNGAAVIAGSLSTYKNGGRLLPNKILQLEQSSPILLSGFKFSGQALGQLPGTVAYGSYDPDPRYFATVSFDRYDDNGNLLSVSKNNGPATSYLYSYNNRYPIAEIQNADYASVEGILGESTVQAFNNQSNPDKTAVDNFLQPLKAALPHAFITSYTYKPMIGISSQTDTKGLTTTYEYDTFNRLESIKDQNGDIVKNYKYNYADGSGLPAAKIPFRSIAVTVSKTKNNCSTGNGSVVDYIIPAGRYTSMVDQATANALAQAAADAGAQRNANEYGTCGTTGTVSLNYSLPGTVQFKLRITNTATSTYTDHTLSGSGAVNNITPATVNLALSEVTATGNTYNFSLNGDAKSGNTTTYSNFAFTANANLTISTAPAGGPHYNTAQTITKTKNNCTSGTGTAVSYTVEANTYSSPTSVADANLLALAGGDAAAQSNANKLGGCIVNGTITYYSQVTSVTKSKNDCPNGVSGIPQTISYPLGAFSSLLSVADADQQLHNAAQSSVNTSGGCAITSGTFDLNYSTNSTWMFTVHVKDAQGNTLNRPSIQGSRVLAGIPGGGTGSITITPYPPDFPLPAGMTFSYSINGSPVQTSTPAHFAGLTLSGTVNVTVTQTTFVSNPRVVSKTKNDCPSGKIGSVVNYPVPAQTSTISQADADQKALTYGNANAQAYANANGTCSDPFVNTELVVTKQKNCPTGQVGSSVAYTVPAGKYSSAISQADANQKAQQDANQNAQNYANTNGACEVPNFTLNYSLPPYQQFSLVLRNDFTNTPITYTISGSGTLANIPGGSSYISIQPAVYMEGVSYTFNVGSYTPYSGTSYFTSGLPLTGTMQLNISTDQTIYYNTLATYKATRACGYGFVGSEVTYTVPAGKYWDLYSQTGADNKANEDLYANAQAYANANGTCTQIYYSQQLTVSKTRNNCAVNYTGSSVSYSVYAGKYTSMISQADANQKAQTDVDANAQNYANTNGTCKPPVTYYSTGMNTIFKKNNCPVGQTNLGIYYNVPYGKYTSLISQADANQKAQDDTNANGQAYANANGTCVSSTFSISYEIPYGSNFIIRVTNNTAGTVTDYTTTGTSGTITGIPIGSGYISAIDQNGAPGYYYRLDGVYNMYWGTQNPVFGSEAHFQTHLSGTKSLVITETIE